jgi:hypothetical protein
LRLTRILGLHSCAKARGALLARSAHGTDPEPVSSLRNSCSDDPTALRVGAQGCRQHRARASLVVANSQLPPRSCSRVGNHESKPSRGALISDHCQEVGDARAGPGDGYPRGARGRRSGGRDCQGHKRRDTHQGCRLYTHGSPLLEMERSHRSASPGTVGRIGRSGGAQRSRCHCRSWCVGPRQKPQTALTRRLSATPADPVGQRALEVARCH